MRVSFLRARYRRIMFFFTGVAINFIIWEVILPRLGLRALSRRDTLQPVSPGGSPVPGAGHTDGRSDDQGRAVPFIKVGCTA